MTGSPAGQEVRTTEMPIKRAFAPGLVQLIYLSMRGAARPESNERDRNIFQRFRSYEREFWNNSAKSLEARETFQKHHIGSAETDGNS